jgi:hypothetical protein
MQYFKTIKSYTWQKSQSWKLSWKGFLQEWQLFMVFPGRVFGNISKQRYNGKNIPEFLICQEAKHKLLEN